MNSASAGREYILLGRFSVHRLDIVMAAFALAWFVYVLAAVRSTELVASDDAFISFQYARNLGHGHGLVFNLGERVWGFTSPLQTLLLGALSSVGMDTVRAAFVTGFLWVAVASLLLYGLSAQILSRLSALAIATFYLSEHTLHGDYALESNLLIVVQLAFLLAVTRNAPRTANILGALSCLARPDSLLLVLPVLLATRDCRRPVYLAWFILIGLLWEVFAFVYFDSLIPQSFHAKAGLSRFWPFAGNAVKAITRGGLAEILGMSATSGWPSRILILLLGVLPLMNREVRKRFPCWFGLILYPWILIGAYSWIGSFQGHNWEFYSAKLLVGVAEIVGLLTMVEWFAGKVQLGRWTRPAIAVLVLACLVANGAVRVRELPRWLETRRSSFWLGKRYDAFRSIAAWLRANTPQDATVCVGEVGTLAYFSNRKVVDDSGIVTRGYLPEERMNRDAFLRRFEPEYAILYRKTASISPSPALQYQQVAYFPSQGYAEFSLLRRR